MEKCQYTEYQRYSNLPKHPISCSITPTYEKEGKRYCYFHYLRLFFTELDMNMDAAKKKQLMEAYPKVFEQGTSIVHPLIFYRKFNELLANYQGNELDISGFVFPMEKTQNNNEQIDLTGIIQTRRDNITIKSQYLEFFDSVNTTKYLSNQSYSPTSLSSGGTIIFQNIHCDNFTFNQKHEEYSTLRFIDCNFQELTVPKDTFQEKVGKIDLNIEKCKVHKYNHNSAVTSISINNKSEINNIPDNINVYSFSISDSVLSNHTKDISITANSILIKDTDIGSKNNRIEKVSLTAPFSSITLDNNILKDPLFSYINHVEIIDKEEGNNGYSTTKSRFHNVDIRNIIFYDSGYEENKDNHPDNLMKINFINCNFNKGYKLHRGSFFFKGILQWFNSSKLNTIPQNIFNTIKKVYLWLRQGIYKEEVSPKRLEYSYLYFKELYDNRGEHIAGSDFYYNYLDIKRKIDNNLSWWDKIFLLLYGWLNGYNTKPERAIIWLFVIIFIATITLFYVDGFDFEKMEIKDKVQKSIAAAILGLVPLKSLEMIKFTNLWSFLIILIENILSPVLITLFTLALRNRFRRNKKEEKE